MFWYLLRANKKDLHKKRLKAIRFVCTSLKIFKIYYAYSVVCTKVYTSAVVLINVHLRIYISIVILTHLGSICQYFFRNVWMPLLYGFQDTAYSRQKKKLKKRKKHLNNYRRDRDFDKYNSGIPGFFASRNHGRIKMSIWSVTKKIKNFKWVRYSCRTHFVLFERSFPKHNSNNLVAAFY